MKSETINELTKALSKMQGELTSVPKESVNPFFKSKYASLDAIWDTIRKPLSVNGLSIIQTTGQDDKGIYIDTMLCHSSGQFVSSYLPINAKGQDPQSIGSAITYARRYSLSAILGVSADDDDDGESGTHKKEQKSTKPPAETKVQTNIQEHFCKEHNTEFFVRGSMKSFAHPLKDAAGNEIKDEKGKTIWCHEHIEIPASIKSETTSAEEFDKLPSASKPQFKRDPSTIKSLADLWGALNTDFKMQPKEAMAELGVNASTEITETPRDCYIKIAQIKANQPK